MYQSKLLDAYKKAQNYVQDKQIAHDLNVNPSRICEMRRGKRYISDSEAVFLAENSGIDPEIALLGCHADRNENPHIKQLWETIAKKFNGHGLHLNTVAYVSFGTLASMPLIEHLQYALCKLMVKCVLIYNNLQSASLEVDMHEVSPNDEKLHFS